jgi:hypothetical protein
MKRLFLQSFGVLLVQACLCSADTITAFAFNSTVNDAITATGTNRPSIGSGTLSLIGGTTGSYGVGSSRDPQSTDNSSLDTTPYPVYNAGNKTAGIQVLSSTAGYSNIVVRWDHESSGSASRYYRFRYSTNGGASFIDWPNATTLTTASKFFAFTNDLTGVPYVNNNPAFMFRIVSEFESTATGTGTNAYVPISSANYSTGGTVHFDYIVVSGTQIFDGNYPPTITTIANQAIRVGQSTGPLAFQVLDAETPASNLVVTASSSNPSVIGTAQIGLSGTSESRGVNVTAGGLTGSSTITLAVIDTGGKSNTTSFTVTVLAANTAPVISSIPATNTLMGAACGPLPFTIGDSETPAGSLSLSAYSGNTALVPVSGVSFSGTDSNRFVTVTPAAGQSGVAPITIQVSDSTNTASTTFGLMVVPSAAVVFNDGFSYANGAVVSNSGNLWANRSGTAGDCVVSNGQLQVSADLTEDVIGGLVGAPYAKGGGKVLYSCFKVKFYNLPNSNPDYFAHFGTASSIRCRIHAFIPVGVDFGTFHLAIANDTNTFEVPIDLTTNVTYTLVTRYNVDAATSTLWINPTSESDPSGVTANDPTSAVNISHYGFRQSSTFDATVFVDDLKVGTSFAAVTSTNSSVAGPIVLTAARMGNKLVLSWTNASYALESAGAVNGTFTNVAGAWSPYTNLMGGNAQFFRLRGN